MLIFFISLFIALSLLTETFGVLFRLLGSINNQPTTGYSIHVRIATLGRFFTFFSAPALGYIVDSGVGSRKISLIGFFTYLLVFVIGVIINTRGESFINFLYSKFTNEKSFKRINFFNLNLRRKNFNVKYYLIVSISFITTSIGVLLVNYIAAILINYKATIIQLSAFITAGGTLLHVFFIDPKLAKSGDLDIGMLNKLVYDYIKARIYLSLALSLFFLLLYINSI